MLTGKTPAEGILDALIHESRKQADALCAMRTALEAGDHEKALEVATVLVGLTPVKRKPTTH